MADRVVSIKLMADATGLVQGFNRASDAAQGLRDKATSTGQKMAQSARENREAWTTVGTGLTAVGVAVTGIGVAALKTGIQYNNLQQTTRAALTTLLGSASAANAQMDKLDAFARNSPFSKATFITAQQQMLAFGIETKKVIPYLDAVQNAVAAAGGNNQQIAEIAFIMAQISSAGKITAQDLMQFGQRGVNAAELIGSQMGKTGAQIRRDITDGSLGADEALDALAAGMSEKFDGAADNVKNTFEGAVDRVKAAWRDFASELAKPLVDPNGGGALVDLLNWAADAMRSFEKLPEPVKNTSSALVGLAGASTLAVGSAMLLLPKWYEFTDAVKRLSPALGDVRGKFANLVPAALAVTIAAVAASLVHAIGDMRGATIASEDLGRSLRKTGDITNDLRRGFSSSTLMSELSDGAIIAENNLRQLNTGIGKLRASFETTFVGETLSLPFLGLGRDLGQAKEQIENLDLALSDLVSSGRAEAAAKGFEQFAEQARRAGWEQEDITAALPKYAAAQEDAKLATEESKNSLEEIQGVAAATSDAISALADEILNFGKSQLDADRASIAMRDSMRQLDELIASGTASLDGYSAAGTKTETMLNGLVKNTLDNASAVLQLTGNQEAANAVLDEGRAKLIDSMTALNGDREASTAWVNERVPNAAAVAAALDGVTGSANSIPTESKANVRTDADNATTKLNRTTDAANAIPPSKHTNVTAETRSANSGISGFLDLLGRIPTVITVGLATAVAGRKAYGGTIGYAHGGTIEKAAYGKTIGGIGGGVYNGTVYGMGTAKSDSVLTMLSRGEEVVQEPYASMYRRELKQMNRGDYQPSRHNAPIIVIPQTGGNELKQQNTINMYDRDPRVVIKQLNREFRGML